MISLPSIKQIVGSYNIRYDKLMELIPTYFAGSDATEINLYIDITTIIKRCSTDVSDTKDKDLILVSSIINMCAHYRQFFKSRLGVYANIFIVLSSMTDTYNRKFVMDYKNSPQQVGSFDLNMINRSCDYLTLITKYIENVYFVQTAYEAGVAIYSLINSKTARCQNFPDIVLTKDIYNYQLASTGAAILRPKKSNMGDVSYIFGDVDAVSIYLLERKVLSVETTLTSSALPCIMALTRVPERHIKSIKSIPVVIKGLNSLVSKGLLTSNTNDIKYICKMLNEEGIKTNDDEIFWRYSAISIEDQFIKLSSGMSDLGSFSICTWNPVNLYDPESLKNLNNNEFMHFPLDIMAL